jgi:hypothetical protein
MKSQALQQQLTKLGPETLQSPVRVGALTPRRQSPPFAFTRSTSEPLSKKGIQ